MDAEALRITLEIDDGSPPIQGTVTGPGGAAGEFQGWTALATLIDSVIAAELGAPRDRSTAREGD